MGNHVPDPLQRRAFLNNSSRTSPLRVVGVQHLTKENNADVRASPSKRKRGIPLKRQSHFLVPEDDEWIPDPEADELIANATPEQLARAKARLPLGDPEAEALLN